MPSPETMTALAYGLLDCVTTGCVLSTPPAFPVTIDTIAETLEKPSKATACIISVISTYYDHPQARPVVGLAELMRTVITDPEIGVLVMAEACALAVSLSVYIEDRRMTVRGADLIRLVREDLPHLGL